LASSILVLVGEAVLAHFLMRSGEFVERDLEWIESPVAVAWDFVHCAALADLVSWFWRDFAGASCASACRDWPKLQLREKDPLGKSAAAKPRVIGICEQLP
jgi:hypothetical protein